MTQPRPYLTYIDDDWLLSLGDGVYIQWTANGDFMLASEFTEDVLRGTADAAITRYDKELALLAPAIKKLEKLPRGTKIELDWIPINQNREN